MRGNRHSEYWLLGGRGSGKSSFCAAEVILSLLKDERVNAIVFRKIAATMRESVYGQLIWAASALGVSDLFRARVSPPELEYLPTGQRILFRGADDPEKSKSIKLSRGYFGIIWFEEISEFSGMSDVRTLKASAARGGRAVTLISGNPPIAPAAWVNAEAAAPAEGRLVHFSDYRGMPEGWLGETFLADAERLRKTDARAYAHMYLGKCVGTGAQVFTNLCLRAITPDERQKFDRIYCGLDFGFAVDPDAFIRLSYDTRLKTAYLLSEYRAVRAPLDALAEAVKPMMGKGERAVCDSADPRMIEELRARGVRAGAARKGAGSVERGIRFLQELSQIVIDPETCPHAAKEFTAYEYERDRDGAPIPRFPDRDNHTLDAVRYALEEVSARREARSVKREKLGL